MIKSDQSSNWYRNISLYLIFSSLFILFLYRYYSPLLDYIDYFDFICDAVIACIIIFLNHAISKENQPYSVISILILGFTLLYISLLTDVMDEIFYNPVIIKNLIENFLQVIAYFTIGYGVYKWLAYNHSVHAELQTLSSIDTLTGTLNRRSFLERADAEFYRSKRYKENLALIMLDVDHFKKINDSLGHSVGDEVLVNLSKNITSRLRKNDLFCRWGGEEFLLLLPKATPEASRIVSEKIHQCIANNPIKLKNGTTIEITISIGCTVLTTDDQSLETVIERADQSMYLSKEGGRNTTTFL